MKPVHLSIALLTTAALLTPLSFAQVTHIKPAPRDVKPAESTPGQTPVKTPPKRTSGNRGPAIGQTTINMDGLQNIDPDSMGKKSQQILKVCKYKYQVSAYKQQYFPNSRRNSHSLKEQLVLTGRRSKAEVFDLDEYINSRQTPDYDRGEMLKNVYLYNDPNSPDHVTVVHYTGDAYFNVSERTMDWVQKAIDDNQGVCVGMNHKLGAFMSGRGKLTPEKTEGFIWSGSECRCR